MGGLNGQLSYFKAGSIEKKNAPKGRAGANAARASGKAERAMARRQSAKPNVAVRGANALARAATPQAEEAGWQEF
jgi:hypothetical protein